MEIKTSKKHTLFLPAFIDDYGFTPEEFRVFSRIMRRSLGSERGCFESVPDMVKNLQISEKLIKRAFKVLVACNAVTRIERKGKTDIFDFNTCEKWKSASELTQIRAKIDGEIKQKDRERKSVKANQVGAETTGVSGCGNEPTVGAETNRVVGAETQYEGTSNKLLVPQEGTPIKEMGEKSPSTTTKTALEVYREFFPLYQLSPYQENLLESASVIETEFRLTMAYWAGRGYQEKKISDILDCYQNGSYKKLSLPTKTENKPKLLSDTLTPFRPQRRIS